MKGFLDLSSSFKLSGIDMTNHSQLTDMEYKKLVKADKKKENTSPNINVFFSVQIIKDSDS